MGLEGASNHVALHVGGEAKIWLKMGKSQPNTMKEESDKVFCVIEEGRGAAVEYSSVCGQI